MTYLDFYKMYVADVIAIDKPPFTCGHFLAVMHNHYPSITKARQTDFTQCSICNSLRALRAHTALTPGQRDLVGRVLQQHLDHVQLERQMETHRESFATLFFAQAMFAAIDTATQRGTALPKKAGRSTHSISQLERMPATVTLA